MHSRFDSQPLPVRIVYEVADAKNSSPEDIQPLGEIIDPEALDILFSSGSDTLVRLQFEYEGYLVIVDDGDVTVEPAQ